MKKLLALLLIPGIAYGGAYAAGAQLPASQTTSHNFFVMAAPHEVYELILDVESQPEWRPDIDRVTMNPNGSWVEHTAGGNIAFTLVEDYPPHAYRVTFAADTGYSGEIRGRLRPYNGGTQITITETVTIPAALDRLVARLSSDAQSFKSHYAEDLRAALEFPLN